MELFSNPFAQLQEMVKQEQKNAKKEASLRENAAREVAREEKKRNPNRDEFRDIFVDPSEEELRAEDAAAREHTEALRRKEERLQNEFLEFVKFANVRKI